MTLSKNNNREIIMQHYLKPNFKVPQVENGITVYSAACVDELHLDLTWKEDKLIHARFSGQGCAVFLASTDIMLGVVLNQSRVQIKLILKHYRNMIHQKGDYDLNLLNELCVFEQVQKHYNRLHCAEMVLLGLEKALNKKTTR